MPFCAHPPLARFVSIAVLAVVFAPLAGCANNPNALTGANASGLAGNGKAYVILDSYENTTGLVQGKARQGVQFVNAAATFNPFYARTPSSMKLGTLPPNAGGISAIDPGTYRLVSMAVAGHPCFFGMGDSPVEFTVSAGEVVYLGALEYHYVSTHQFLDVLSPQSYEISFGVVDELASHLDQLTSKLALLPGHPAIRTRLMTIRRPDVPVAGANEWGGPRFAPAPQTQAPDAPNVPEPDVQPKTDQESEPKEMPPPSSSDDQI